MRGRDLNRSTPRACRPRYEVSLKPNLAQESGESLVTAGLATLAWGDEALDWISRALT